MTLRELLEAVPAGHRQAVAKQIGLGPRAGAKSIAAALLEEERLRGIAEGLSTGARRLALAALLTEGGRIPVTYFGPGGPSAGESELERHGLVFAHERRGWGARYEVPAELRAPLSGALAGAHAAAAGRGRATRYLAAPLQLAHDAAALAAFMQRTPVRVKTDGDIYARLWPKLFAALPPLDLYSEDDTLGDVRLGAALRFLRQRGLVRLRVDGRPGREARRELVPCGDIAAELSADPVLLAGRLLEVCSAHDTLTAAGSALTAALGGDTVSLAGFGKALSGLLEEVGERLGSGWTDTLLALRALEIPWLAGELEIGIGRGGRPAAVRLRRPEPARPEGPPAVCQSNFELVLLRPPTPAERAVLELAGERATGQAHVYKLTRDSLRSAARAGLGPGGPEAALERLAGDLPANVRRTIADWVRGVGPPLRLRSALFLDAGEPVLAGELADGALAGLVVERLGERLLAVRVEELDLVEQALGKEGHELDPEVERVSGEWEERPYGHGADRSFAAQGAWQPVGTTEPEESEEPVTSRIEETSRDAPAAAGAEAAELPDLDGELDGGESGDPIEVVLEAIDRGLDLEIVYAGARGMTHREVTPTEVDASRLHAFCHLRQDDRSFWLHSILVARAVSA